VTVDLPPGTSWRGVPGPTPPDRAQTADAPAPPPAADEAAAADGPGFEADDAATDAGRTTQTLVDAVRTRLASGLDLPPLGEGASTARLAALVEWGRQDLSLARVLEAHVDAVQILRERGRDAEPRAWYGVWAAEGPSSPLRLRRAGRGGGGGGGGRHWRSWRWTCGRRWRRWER
jgi:hypothetical protein